MTTNNRLRRTKINDEESLLVSRIRETVGDQCVTQYARSLDMNHESVRRYIRGMTSPPAVFLMRVVERYGVDANWLLLGDDSQNTQTLRTIETVQLAAELERRAAAIGRAANDRACINSKAARLTAAGRDDDPRIRSATRMVTSDSAQKQAGVSDTGPGCGGQ